MEPRPADSGDTAKSAVDLTTFVLYIFAFTVAYHATATFQDVFFGPLSHFPGPRLYALTRLPLIWAQIRGNDNQILPALHAKYGPAVRIAPGELSFADAKAWQDIYGFKKVGQPKFPKDPKFYLASYNKVHSLATADDATHARQRKILSHAFSDRAMREQQPILQNWARNMLARLQDASLRIDKIDMLKFYNCTTFDIMGDLSFSEGLNMLAGSELDPWVKTIFTGIKAATIMRGIREINGFMDWVVQILLSSAWVRRKEKEHWDYSTNRVNRRLKNSPARPDLWSRVVEHSDGPDGLSIAEHHSIASVFMIAGTETTATALSGTTYQLLRHPQILTKLIHEIRANYRRFDDLSFESMAKLRYLHAVLQEGLRIYPPAPSKLPRQVPRGGAAVGDKWIPEGTIVSIHQLATYQLEANFKRANEFCPERWLGDPEFVDDKLNVFEPFKLGLARDAFASCDGLTPFQPRALRRVRKLVSAESVYALGKSASNVYSDNCCKIPIHNYDESSKTYSLRHENSTISVAIRCSTVSAVSRVTELLDCLLSILVCGGSCWDVAYLRYPTTLCIRGGYLIRLEERHYLSAKFRPASNSNASSEYGHHPHFSARDMPAVRTSAGRASQACTSCRARKTRCYGSKGASLACLRCHTLELQCSLTEINNSGEVTDKSRVVPMGSSNHNCQAVDERLAQVEKTVAHLASLLDCGSVDEERDPTVRLEQAAPLSVIQDAIPMAELNGDCLEDTTLVDRGFLTTAQTDTLLQLFRRHCGRWIAVDESDEGLQVRSSLLSCACCLVAARHSCLESSSVIASTLFAEVKAMFGESLLTVTRDFEFFQSALVLSLWSTTAGQRPLSLDSWLITGIAFQRDIAMRTHHESPLASFDGWQQFATPEKAVVWVHLCLSHLHACISMRRKSMLGRVDIERIESLSHSQTDNFKIRMLAETLLYWVMYQECVASDVVLVRGQAALRRWRLKWSSLFQQPRHHFLQMSFWFAQLLFYEQSLHNRSTAVRESLVLQMLDLCSEMLRLAMNTSDERSAYLTDHIYHMITFAGVTLTRLLSRYEVQLRISHNIDELDELAVEVAKWLKSIGSECHIGKVSGKIIDSLHRKTRPQRYGPSPHRFDDGEFVSYDSVIPEFLAMDTIDLNWDAIGEDLDTLSSAHISFPSTSRN
nr:cytochrome p450 monooxygenase hmp1 [Quercus suber]